MISVVTCHYYFDYVFIRVDSIISMIIAMIFIIDTYEVMVDGMGAVHVTEASDAPGGLVIITHQAMDMFS